MSSKLRVSIRASVVLFGLGAVTYASSAMACGDDVKVQPASLQGQRGAQLFLEADLPIRSIVGMWSFTMTPTAGPGDSGYQQWHSDGTELMNSAGRSPASENFCMGVWRQTGLLRYHLNHYALSYDPTLGTINARVIIKEDVTLSPTGTSYSGTFTLDVYDPSGTTQVGHQDGQVTAQRVSAN